MEFNSLRDISDYLVANGFFYAKHGATLKAHIKTGEGLNNVKELLPIEEIRLNEIVQNAVVNPLLNMDTIKLKKLAIIIDYQIVEKYSKKKAELNNNRKLKKELADCEYIYIKNKQSYYKIKDKKLLIIDVGLIPKKKNIVSFDNYNKIRNALIFEEKPNKYTELYEQEIKKFNELAISNW